MDPEARLLRYFLAVADELNFSRAAERLHIAQPSLSAQIRQLETQLGVPLLVRTTRSVSLTEAGRALLDLGPAALGGLEQAWEAARAAGRGDAGALRLAYPLSAGHDTVPQLVRALHDVHPRITVASEVLPSPAVLAAVRAGRADVGIARAPSPQDGVRLRPLRHDRLGVLIAADHPLAVEATVPLAAVAGYPLIVHPRAANPPHHDFILNLFSSHGLHPAVAERDIAFDLTQGSIVGSTACTIVGQSTALDHPGTMRWVPLSEPVAVPVAIVLPSGGPSATARLFEQVAHDYAMRNGWLALDRPDRPAVESAAESGHHR